MSRRAVLAALGSGLALALAGGTLAAVAPTATAALYPTTPPAPMCKSDRTLAPVDGPATAPAGAVVVPLGDNTPMEFELRAANTVFWFAPGKHYFTGGMFKQIQPGSGSTYIGAPGAVLSGDGGTPGTDATAIADDNRYAFTAQASGVTIKHLVVQDFRAPTDEGVVNHDSGNDWVIEHNTIQDNRGGAMMSGARQIMRGNCLRDNGQYGLNAFKAGNTISDILLEGNEFVGNNIDDLEASLACGCTGAMKFWAVNGADVRNNWIHHNHGAGVWADTNDNDFLIEGNLIEGNDGQAIFYEISYNAIIRDNMIRNNTWNIGRQFANRSDNFPIGTIYLSEADGDARVLNADQTLARTDKIEIYGNKLENNWGGIAGWANSDRFCNSPASTTPDCTMIVGPSNTSNCSDPGIQSDPLYTDCRWWTSGLDIHHNEFIVDPALIDGGCLPQYCALQALVANFGTVPSWSPYKGRTIQDAQWALAANNKWHDNAYVGPWRFNVYEPGKHVGFAEWQGSTVHPDDPGRTIPLNQDVGSTYNAPPAPPPAAANDTATTAAATAVTIAVLANDTGDGISVTSVGTPTSGTATKNADDTITYTPNSGFSGSDSFSYTITDSAGQTATGTVTVTVNPPPPADATEIVCQLVAGAKVGDPPPCEYRRS